MSTPDTGLSTSEESSDPLEATVNAYRRSDGGVGVRNHILVAPSVICSHIVSERIADTMDGTVSIPHDHSCAQAGSDHEQAERTTLNLAHTVGYRRVTDSDTPGCRKYSHSYSRQYQNPNVAGVTVVGLGCEHLQSGPSADRIADTGVEVRETAIQDASRSDACIEEEIEATEELTAAASSADRTGGSLADLTVGVVSSDLTTSTREVADPLVGDTVDALLDMGARVAVAGTERLAHHAEAAADRAASEAAADTIRGAAERDIGQPSNVRGVVRHATDHPFDSIVGFWGESAVRVLEALGCEVVVPDEGGSGRVPLSQGMISTAASKARTVADALDGYTRDGLRRGRR